MIPNAVPQPKIATAASSVRSQLGIGQKDFMAVLVAILRPEKRVDVFIRAVQRAQRADPRIRGVVVGPGSEFTRLKALAREDGTVQLLGERRDGADIVNAGDVCCLSSNAEGLPMALLEAMALGKPIVATDVGGVSDAVEHERTGLLVPIDDVEAFADALVRLSSNHLQCEQFGRLAKERHLALFSVEKMLARYEEAFAEVVNGQARSKSGAVSPQAARNP
jgi:glycosyltransferase involved in cell wall biosynthesis